MPRNNSATRRSERQRAADARKARKRARELQQSSHANLRVLGTVSLELQRIRQNEDDRLCDICNLPRWECELLAEDGAAAHIFSPMTPQQQLRHEEEREVARTHEEDLRNQHFTGASHPSDCDMLPRVCYATAGISATR